MLDFVLNISQTSNDILFKELQTQDKILNEQTNVYLKKIVNQNEEIISLLQNGALAKR